MVRRNTAFPHDVTQYTIRNAVQSVRSSGGFVPQRRDMNGRGLQKPAEDRPQWGQTPVTHTTTEKKCRIL